MKPTSLPETCSSCNGTRWEGDNQTDGPCKTCCPGLTWDEVDALQEAQEAQEEGLDIHKPAPETPQRRGETHAPETPTPSTTFYKLWKHLFDEHGLVVTESEMNEIARLCPKVIREPREGDFKYLITYGGGLGPDVWDREVEVSAVNIQDAINQVIGDVEDAGGWIYAIDQNDYPPISRQKLESSIADLERALAEAKRENRKLTLELGAERMGVASRAGTLDLEVELKETKRHRDSLSSEIERLKAERQWQPIASAPKDGTEILAFLPWSNSWQVICFMQKRWETAWDGEDLMERDQPTKWMPLPAARTTQEGQG